jgi:CcmD family protein
MTASEKYVAAAYLVVFLVVLVYVLIMATKVSRLEQEVAELIEQARRKPIRPAPKPEDVHAEVEVG